MRKRKGAVILALAMMLLLVPVMAQEGIKYVISWPNTDRGGNAHSRNIDGMPFWWVGPDGHSKVLFLQPGKYSNSGSMDKGNTTGRPWFGETRVRCRHASGWGVPM